MDIDILTRIRPFLDEDGKIKQVPAHGQVKIAVLEYLTCKFEKGRTYSEKQVNQIIDEWHAFHDYFILRRLLIDYKFLERTPNGAEYWVTEEQKETSEG